MTGLEFKAIRKFNQITQRDICEVVGWKTIQSCYDLEKRDVVPITLVNVLSKFIRKDLTKDDVLKEVLEQIPAKYFMTKRALFRSIFQ